MRSARPKPLHLICGRAMVLHVIHALERLHADAHRRRRRPRRRAGHQEGAGAGPAVGQRRVRRAARPARHRRRRGDRHDGVPRRRPRRRLDHRRAARRHAAAAARDARRARRHPRRQRQRGDAADERRRRPDRLRPGRSRAARRAGAAHRRAARRHARGAGHRRGRHQHLRVPPRPARPGAAPPVARQRAGRVLPDRRRRRARRDGPPGRRACRRRPRRPRASTTAGSWRWPSASCASRTNRHWLLNGVTMLDPRQTFIDVTVQLGRDVTLYPGTILQGNTVDRRRLRDRPRHPPRRLRRRRATAVVEHTVGQRCRGRRRRPRRPVRPSAGGLARRRGHARPGRSTLHPTD